MYLALLTNFIKWPFFCLCPCWFSQTSPNIELASSQPSFTRFVGSSDKSWLFFFFVINNQELRNKRSNRKHKIQNTDSVLRPSPSWTRTLWLSSVGSDDTTGGTFRFFTIWITSGVNWAEIERSTGPSSSVPPLKLSNIFELVTC